MDPNANLEEQRRLREKITRDLGVCNTVLPRDIEKFVELVAALDEWISEGGFLPCDWQYPVDVVGQRVQCTNTIGFKREGD